MSKKDIDQPEDFDQKIDHLLKNSVVSMARDIEKDFFNDMDEEKIVATVYSRYSGLFMPTGCIEKPKRIYRNLYAKYEELLDEEKKLARRKWLDFRHKFYWGVAVVVLVIFTGYIAQKLGIEIKIPGLR